MIRRDTVGYTVTHRVLFPVRSVTTLPESPATGDDGATIEQIATDVGVHPMTPTKWLRQAEVDEGAKSGTTTLLCHQCRLIHQICVDNTVANAHQAG